MGLGFGRGKINRIVFVFVNGTFSKRRCLLPECVRNPSCPSFVNKIKDFRSKMKE